MLTPTTIRSACTGYAHQENRRACSFATGHWKIECDALTDADWDCLAYMVSERMAFSAVEGVPTGGLRFARALEKHAGKGGPLLIADDVLTTGGSMEEHRAGREAQGVVAFSRCEEVPRWIVPLFQLDGWAAVPGEPETDTLPLLDRMEALAAEIETPMRCTSPAYGAPGYQHCAACCGGTMYVVTCAEDQATLDAANALIDAVQLVRKHAALSAPVPLPAKDANDE